MHMYAVVVVLPHRQTDTELCFSFTQRKKPTQNFEVDSLQRWCIKTMV